MVERLSEWEKDGSPVVGDGVAEPADRQGDRAGPSDGLGSSPEVASSARRWSRCGRRCGCRWVSGRRSRGVWRRVSRCGRSRGGWVGRRRRSRVRSPRTVVARRYRACRGGSRRRCVELRRPKPSKLAACRAAAGGGGGEARAAVVAAADLGLAGGRVPRRSGDARVARDDLPVVVRAVPRRAAQGTDPLSALRAHAPAGRGATR